MHKNYFIWTSGCQMNVHDSEKIAGIFVEKGYREASGLNEADIIVFNTCSIREKAEQKFYSELGRLKTAKIHNPHLKVAVAGCIAQQEGRKLFKRFPYVDFVFGPYNIDNLHNWINNKSQNPAHICIDFGIDFYRPSQRAASAAQTTAIKDNPGYHTNLLPVKREGHVRALVSIMYGCDNFCAYCVVPYTRGRETSRPINDIYHEVRSLAESGFKEITLLGQNVNSYGKNSHDNIDFSALLFKLHEINGIDRIRFVTSHPRDLSEKLIFAIRDLPKICEHLHLPIQAGSDRILEVMNRGYTYNEYKRKIDLLRTAIPDIAITTDIIVGFPGETENDYQLTLNILSEIEYDGIFAFKYSKRPGTRAIQLDDHVDEKIKSERLSRILELQELITYKINKRNEGKIVEVLVEGKSENDEEKLMGRTTTNKIVNFYGDDKLIGSMQKIKILEAKQHSLYGKII